MRRGATVFTFMDDIDRFSLTDALVFLGKITETFLLGGFVICTDLSNVFTFYLTNLSLYSIVQRGTNS